MKSFFKAVLLKSAVNIGILVLAAGLRYFLTYFQLDGIVHQNLVWFGLVLLILFTISFGIRSLLEDQLANPSEKKPVFSTAILNRVKAITGYGIGISIFLGVVLLFYLFVPNQLTPFLLFVGLIILSNSITLLIDVLKTKSTQQNQKTNA